MVIYVDSLGTAAESEGRARDSDECRTVVFSVSEFRDKLRAEISTF